MSETLTIPYVSVSMAADPYQDHNLFSNAQNVYVTNSQFIEVTGFKYHVCGAY